MSVHLDAWDEAEAIDKKDELIPTLETPGWEVFQEAVSLRVAALREQIEQRTQSMEADEITSVLGEIRGLNSIERLTDGVILVGTEAEEE